MANTYDQGDIVRVTGTFTDPLSSNDPVDPGVVNLSYKKPDGTRVNWVYLTDSEIVKDSTGVYHADITIDVDGVWYYRWWSTGSAQAAEEQSFIIEDSLVEAAGAGSDKIPITVLNDGEAVSGASVYITSDSDGNTTVAGPLLTGDLGKVFVYLTATTTYYVWIIKDGQQSIRGTAFAAATTGHTFTMTDEAAETRIWDMAQSPRRITTDEGTIEERSIDELIKASRHEASQSVGDGPLHGLRISRCKPAGPI